MYYVYVLKSERNGKIYIGYSSNLRKRFFEHNKGESLATKPFLPYKLIFYEAFFNKKDAKNREEILKLVGGRSVKKC